MQFQVTEIDFDFDSDDGTPSIDYQSEIIYTALSEIWEAEDDDDLVDQITESTGWCIKFIDYHCVK
jgi:hypothetical protein